MLQDLINQPEALLHLANTHPYPSVDITRLEHGNVEIETMIGRIADCLAGVESAAAGTPDIPAGPELPRQLAAQNPGAGGAVLQRGGIVVKLDELREQPANFVQRRRDLPRAVCSEITRDAARHDDIHHQPMPKARLRGPQRLLAQDAAVGVHERERGIVANGPDITEMVGETLELRHQRPQINRTRWNLDIHRCLDRMGKGERISDCAVARGPTGQACRRIDAGARHQRLDALVHVAKALLQSNHRLAVGRKTEMPGFDDAGMNRADGNLVQTFARNGQECIRRAGLQRVTAMPERALHIPKAEIEPRPHVG